MMFRGDKRMSKYVELETKLREHQREGWWGLTSRQGKNAVDGIVARIDLIFRFSDVR